MALTADDAKRLEWWLMRIDAHVPLKEGEIQATGVLVLGKDYGSSEQLWIKSTLVPFLNKRIGYAASYNVDRVIVTRVAFVLRPLV